MVDSTLVHWVNELRIGISHSRIPWSSWAGFQGYFKTDRHAKLAKGTSMNSYLVCQKQPNSRRPV